MMDIGLREQAKESFGFLVSEYGYQCVESKLDRVRFESLSTFIELVFDKNRSFELRLLIGKVSAKEISFTIHDVLRLRGTNNIEPYSFIQVTTRNSLALWIKKLSKALRLYGREFINGEERCFVELERQREKDIWTYALKRKLRTARFEAESAWRKNDYASVVEALKPLRSVLTKTELKKLELAEWYELKDQ